MQAVEWSVHQKFSDVAVDSLSNPSLIRVRLMQSKKTDPFRQGVEIHIGRTGTDLCPVTEMLVYLAQRGREAAPLFLCSDRMPLSMQRVKEVRAAQEAGGLCPVTGGTCSFKIGAATTTAELTPQSRHWRGEGVRFASAT